MTQRAFPEGRRKRRSANKRGESPTNEAASGNALYRYFSDRGVRETIESVVVAVMLALLFRAFEAEAFVIPTGSMAPTLMGRHRDVECDKCGYRYRTGASEENPDYPLSKQAFVTETACPICHYSKVLDPDGKPNERSFSGDRILVDKFAYAFKSPDRWDVIVFKYPGNPKQNYIKRLVGLPGETLRLICGDVYVAAPGTTDFRIQSKDPRKLRAMLQVVDDTYFIADQLNEVGWPSRWNEWSNSDDDREWSIHNKSEHPTFEINASDGETRWLRYRHLAPHPLEWLWFIESDELPPRAEDFTGALITDFYPYNDSMNDRAPDSYRNAELRKRRRWLNNGLTDEETESVYREWMGTRGLKQGLHWVGDLAVELDVEVKGDSGAIFVDLVEGGVHYTCEINLANGNAVITASDSIVQFVGRDGETLSQLTGDTPIDGKGSYDIRFANCDNRIYLWVNNKPIELNGRGDFLRDEIVVPRWSPEDPGDAQPVGFGAKDASVAVTRARVLRDIYYTQGKADGVDYTAQEIDLDGISVGVDIELIHLMMEAPEMWDDGGSELFASVYESSRTFTLKDNQLFPMGDNSPASADARSWTWIENHIESEDLVGKALFVYWPHSWNRPIPFFPNFRRMGFIR